MSRFLSAHLAVLLFLPLNFPLFAEGGFLQEIDFGNSWLQLTLPKRSKPSFHGGLHPFYSAMAGEPRYSIFFENYEKKQVHFISEFLGQDFTRRLNSEFGSDKFIASIAEIHAIEQVDNHQLCHWLFNGVPFQGKLPEPRLNYLRKYIHDLVFDPRGGVTEVADLKIQVTPKDTVSIYAIGRKGQRFLNTQMFGFKDRKMLFSFNIIWPTDQYGVTQSEDLFKVLFSKYQFVK